MIEPKEIKSHQQIEQRRRLMHSVVVQYVDCWLNHEWSRVLHFRFQTQNFEREKNEKLDAVQFQQIKHKIQSIN
jgi:hypothetical protein